MELTFDLFVHLFEEYYLSDDPSALGNFINGKLSYDEEESDDEVDPGLLDHKDHHGSSVSIHSMDDDLKEDEAPKKSKKKEEEKSRSTIRLHEISQEVKNKCCSLS